MCNLPKFSQPDPWSGIEALMEVSVCKVSDSEPELSGRVSANGWSCARHSGSDSGVKKAGVAERTGGG